MARCRKSETRGWGARLKPLPASVWLAVAALVLFLSATGVRGYYAMQVPRARFYYQHPSYYYPTPSPGQQYFDVYGRPVDLGLRTREPERPTAGREGLDRDAQGGNAQGGLEDAPPDYASFLEVHTTAIAHHLLGERAGVALERMEARRRAGATSKAKATSEAKATETAELTARFRRLETLDKEKMRDLALGRAKERAEELAERVRRQEEMLRRKPGEGGAPEMVAFPRQPFTYDDDKNPPEWLVPKKRQPPGLPLVKPPPIPNMGPPPPPFPGTKEGEDKPKTSTAPATYDMPRPPPIEPTHWVPRSAFYVDTSAK